MIEINSASQDCDFIGYGTDPDNITTLLLDIYGSALSAAGDDPDYLERLQGRLDGACPEGTFEAGSARRLQALLPHLRLALKIRDSLTRARRDQEALAAILDGWSAGLLVVDEGAHPVLLNQPARARLGAGDGLVLQQGRLATSSAAATARLRGMIADAAAGSAAARQSTSQALALERSSGGQPPLNVLVLPLAAPTLALVLVTAPEDGPAVKPGWLQRLFKLTPAEARLAAEIAGGRSVEEAALRLRIGIGTARVHLKHIFSKTATRRQAELVCLLLRLGGQLNF